MLENNKIHNNFLDIQNLSTKFSIKELVFKYVSYFPLFILSIGVALAVSTIYIRYKVPMYKSTAQMIVKTSDDNLNNDGNANDLVSNALYGGKTVNMDNEISKIYSKDIVKKTVIKNQFNIYYLNEGKIKNSDLFKSGPFTTSFLKIPDSLNTYYIHVSELNPFGGKLYIRGAENNIFTFKWNVEININGLIAIFKPRYPITNISYEPFSVIWKPISFTTNEIFSKLNFGIKGKTTIILLSLETENPNKGSEILNAYIKEYKNANIESKNVIRKNSIDFINNRLEFVGEELAKLELDITNYKKKNGVIDVVSQRSEYLGKIGNVDESLDKFRLQNSFIEIIENYVGSPNYKDELVPTNLGIEDMSLISSIRLYNELQIKKKKESLQLTTEGFMLVETQKQIEDVRLKILESLKNIRKQNVTIIKDRSAKQDELLGKLNLLPNIENQLLELKRQQSIKQDLYLYLYKKREETAIANASTVANYEQLDTAVASNIPIEPKVSNIRNFALLLGLIIPILIIYLIDLLNDKVTVKEDITKKLALPIVGEISHVNEKTNIVVNNSRSISAEQFRILRSNLQFILPKDKPNAQTILITSSISGEGKSFISLNLAGILAYSGKKVALLEFDLRKLSNLKEFQSQTNPKGITNYLIGQTESFEEIKFSLKQFPTLDIFNTGPIPPNPAELMMDTKVASLMAWLKERYDYIVLDTAPVGLVSDSFALVPYIDVVLYVIRQRYTFKKQLEFIQEIAQSEKLKNISLVVNDVQMGGRYGYYGYGYGYGYGYLYKYGYGKKYGTYGAYGYGGVGKYFSAKSTDPNGAYFDAPQPPQRKWWQIFKS